MTDETTKANDPLVRRYNNHTITLNPQDMMFHISGPEFEDYKPEYCRTASYALATQKIDVEVSKNQQLRMKNLKFSAKVITPKGEIVEITAINRGTGEIRGVTSRHVYPYTPELLTMVRQLALVQQEFHELSNKLEPFHINTSCGYGRIDQEDYPRKLLQLQETINKKTKLAKQTLKPQQPEENNSENEQPEPHATTAIA